MRSSGLVSRRVSALLIKLQQCYPVLITRASTKKSMNHAAFLYSFQGMAPRPIRIVRSGVQSRMRHFRSIDFLRGTSTRHEHQTSLLGRRLYF